MENKFEKETKLKNLFGKNLDFHVFNLKEKYIEDLFEKLAKHNYEIIRKGVRINLSKIAKTRIHKKGKRLSA